MKTRMFAENNFRDDRTCNVPGRPPKFVNVRQLPTSCSLPLPEQHPRAVHLSYCAVLGAGLG